MSDFSVIIDYFAGQGELNFLYWIFGATFGLILLFVIARLVRNIVAGRVRQIERFGMDFDSVADMLDKGLLSSEEAKRVKSVLARHFSQLYDKKPAEKSPGPSIFSAEAELATAVEGAQKQPSSTPRGQPAQTAPASAVEPGATTEQQPPSASRPDLESVELPPDVMDMHEAGMITDEELVALRRFYAARARQPK